MLKMIYIENKEGKLCDHGCGQIAHYKNASGKLCCCESFYQCPGYKQRQSEDTKNRPPSIPKGTFLKDKSGICPVCNHPHNGRYGSGRYCSSECAHKATIQHTNKEETNRKRSETLKNRSNDQIFESALQGAITYNKNHPDHQIQLPVKGERKEILYKGNIITKHFSKPCKICGQFGCPEPDQCSHMKRLKLERFSKIMDLSKLGTIDIYIEYQKLKRYIYDCYINQHLSTPDIAKLLNTDWVCVMFLLKKFNIQKRSKSESAIYATMNHPEAKTFQGYTGYHCGYHTSWENKTFWYRSSYELDYANLLDNAKISYDVEKVRLIYWSSLLNRQKLMIPDFYLPDTNTLVEVKSDFTYLEQDYRDRLAILVPMGYNCKLLLEHQWYGIDNIPKQKDGVNITCLD